jgi:MEMO1 family protein
MASRVRPPAVAGKFYPSDPSLLRANIQSYLSPRPERLTAFGCIVPHAGYMYSGQVAGAVYSALDLPACCILLCPNHTGMGQPLAIMSSGEWQTPLGSARIDAEMATSLRQNFPLLTEDDEAHRKEHAAEVELPFLQLLVADLTFVPIALGTANFEVLCALGNTIADVLERKSGKVLIIASSDMNHYEDDRVTREKDGKAIECILALDARGLFDVVMKEEISMCGFGPAVAMLTASSRLGATRGELIKYATSGDVSGDRDMVVGYAGIVIR